MSTVHSSDDLAMRLDDIMSLSPIPSMVMLSGGEPTIHPQFDHVLRLAASKGLPHLMVITNGRKIAKSRHFAKSFAGVPNCEVYLQFDSLDDAALMDIRGDNLSETRRMAIENLRAAQIPATLVCVVKRGVNDQEIASIIEFALQHENIRGVTFQPLRFMGRTEGSDPHRHAITLTEVRSRILDGSRMFSSIDLAPHPLSPETVCVGYFSRKSRKPVTGRVNRFLFGHRKPDPRRNNSPLFFPPSLQSKTMSYADLFRVSIVSYLDRFTYTEQAARLCTFAFSALRKNLGEALFSGDFEIL